MPNQTTADVAESFKNNLSTVEVHESDLAEGVRVAVDANEAGAFYRTLRTEGLDWNSRRIGSSIVAHVPAEEASPLKSLFL